MTDLERVLRPLLTDATVDELAASFVDDPTVTRWWTEPVDYTFGTPTTVGALRLKAETKTEPGAKTENETGAVEWSVFVKAIRSVRHWPLLHTLPPAVREAAMASDFWRFEADVYATDLTEALPAGLRLPVVHRVADLGDEHLAMILEDVPTLADPQLWDTARFAKAAELLGRASARLTERDALPVQSRTPAGPLAVFYDNYLVPLILPTLQSDDLWAHPLLKSADATLRTDLKELASRLPAVLDRLAHLPQVMVHGDASPQNLLIPADQPDTFVAIDWSLGGLAPAGEDLAQLLLGLAHAGQLELSELTTLRPILVTAFAAGLRAEGRDHPEADLAYALDGGLLFRSAFTALPLARLQEPLTDELAETFRSRFAMTRHLVDQALAMPR
ncbi:aminoglycoside phosphotransferase family protein [Kribbella sp. NBC_00382]|uniref:phosphotransferase n=1 Tax=Kribbella sp. NBC_00382 TaxID=2975967 RepID=UPI002E21E43D